MEKINVTDQMAKETSEKREEKVEAQKSRIRINFLEENLNQAVNEIKNLNLKFTQSMDQIEGDLITKDEKLLDLEDKFNKS